MNAKTSQSKRRRTGRNTSFANVPALDCDALALTRYGHKVSPNGKLERRIVANLIAHCGNHGFVPSYVWDGEEATRVHDAKSAMECIFNLDEASLRFVPAGAEVGKPDPYNNGYTAHDNEHGVLLILGNGIDIVSDWNYNAGDADGFNACMEAFDAEEFA